MIHVFNQAKSFFPHHRKKKGCNQFLKGRHSVVLFLILCFIQYRRVLSTLSEINMRNKMYLYLLYAYVCVFKTIKND